MAYVNVLLPVRVSKPFTYLAADNDPPPVGAFVNVPFRGKVVTGVVWMGEPDTTVPAAKLKNIVSVHAHAALSTIFCQYLQWLSEYTMTPVGMALKLAMPVAEGFSDKVSRVKKATIPNQTPKPATLNADQEKALGVITEHMREHRHHTFLLDGVTGSGKTEVYVEAILRCLAAGRQALILLPEIALSTQMLHRITERLGFTPLVWHSGVTPAQRRDGWRDVLSGTAKVVIGARSSLFLPYKDLGLIVVDEEHDGSYKQEDGVIYQGRDMAVARGKIEGLPVVLVSATPSLESVHNLQTGKYTLLHLPERHGTAQLADVTLIDLRKHKLPQGQWLSDPLRTAIAEHLLSGQQAMLFMNRRGYAPLTLCQSCGHRWQCPQCSAWLVAHKLLDTLQCHHCGYLAALPEECPACGNTDSITACGPGIERVAEEAIKAFPQARVAELSSDTMRTRKQAETMIAAVASGEINLLVGTQIIAKGYHFPNLTLVGVVDGDLGLTGGDLRAAEKTWQLLHQVGGRAGRAEKPGQVYIQTFLPEHPVMQTLKDHARDRFVEEQLMEREFAALPPFGRLAAVLLEGRSQVDVERAARALAMRIPSADGISILGPAPAPLTWLRGNYRLRFLVKSPKNYPLQKLLHFWLDSIKLPSSIHLKVDIDPYSFL